MGEDTLFTQASIVRGFTLQAFDSLTEEAADMILPGFNNNIRWHLGHIYTTQEWLLFYHGGERANIPSHFNELFPPGTKPADWKTEPPSLATLRSLLTEQAIRIKETFGGRLSEDLKKPVTSDFFKSFTNTLDDLFVFTLHHEMLHCGFLRAMKRTIQEKS